MLRGETDDAAWPDNLAAGQDAPSQPPPPGAQDDQAKWRRFNQIFDAAHAEVTAVARMRGVPLLPDQDVQSIVDRHADGILGRVSGPPAAGPADWDWSGPAGPQTGRSEALAAGAAGEPAPAMAPDAVQTDGFEARPETLIAVPRSRLDAPYDDSGPLRPSVNDAGPQEASWWQDQIDAHNPHKDFTVSGSWSAPLQPASPGQSGGAEKGAAAMQAAYASGKGGVYVVDPQNMGMDFALKHIGRELHTSLTDPKGFMHRLAQQAERSATRSVQFDSKSWGSTGFREFDGGPVRTDGRSVGRFAGFIRGQLQVDPKTRRYTVMGKIFIRSDRYNWDRDGQSGGANALIGLGEWFNKLIRPGQKAAPRTIDLHYNRYYKFQTSGRY